MLGSSLQHGSKKNTVLRVPEHHETVASRRLETPSDEPDNFSERAVYLPYILKGHLEIARLLVENLRGKTESTQGAQQQKPSAIKFAGGANIGYALVSAQDLDPVNSRDASGCTPLDHALLMGHFAVAEYLRAHGGLTDQFDPSVTLDSEAQALDNVNDSTLELERTDESDEREQRPGLITQARRELEKEETETSELEGTNVRGDTTKGDATDPQAKQEQGVEERTDGEGPEKGATRKATVATVSKPSRDQEVEGVERGARVTVAAVIANINQTRSGVPVRGEENGEFFATTE